MTTVSASERTELAGLVAALFRASKTVRDADRYLLGIDRRTLLRQLGEYRQVSLSSTKAAEQAGS